MTRHQHLISTKATVEICRCGQIILTGLAEGVRARINPTPLNRLGIIATILAGKQLFRLSTRELVDLDPTRLRGHIQRPRGPTFTTHTCGQQIPPAHQQVTEQSQTEAAAEGIPY